MSTGQGNPNPNLITFFSAATSDANSTAFNVPFSKGLFAAQGTWDGATVTFFQVTPNGNYVPVSDLCLNPISMTSDGAVGIDFIVWNQSMYATITGSGGSTSLTVTLQRVA